MLMILNGPAAGKLLAASRAPRLLRVAIDGTGHATALAEPQQKLGPNEFGYVYLFVRHLVDPDDKAEPHAAYQLFDWQPNQADFSNREVWEAWCMSMASEPPPAPKKKIDSPPAKG